MHHTCPSRPGTGSTGAHHSQAHRRPERHFGMKFHLSTAKGNIVTGLGPGWVRIGATEYRESLVLTPEAVTPGFAASGFDGLADRDFAALLAYQPELVILGTGA